MKQITVKELNKVFMVAESQKAIDVAFEQLNSQPDFNKAFEYLDSQGEVGHEVIRTCHMSRLLYDKAPTSLSIDAFCWFSMLSVLLIINVENDPKTRELSIKIFRKVFPMMPEKYLNDVSEQLWKTADSINMSLIGFFNEVLTCKQ